MSLITLCVGSILLVIIGLSTLLFAGAYVETDTSSCLIIGFCYLLMLLGGLGVLVVFLGILREVWLAVSSNPISLICCGVMGTLVLLVVAVKGIRIKIS